jgi:pimeloyl-ACP methyl ester carboxylesterase
VKTSIMAVFIAISAAFWSSNADAGSSPPVPSATMSVGTLTVEKYGSGEPAVILIPGLACGSWVWDGTIPALTAKHTVYAVTLAGFDGTKPVPAPMLDKADASIQQLIDQEHLVKPVIVGHSLGGFLAVRFAEEHSAELSRAVSVDGLPVFPTMAQMTADERAAGAKQFFDPLRGQTHEQFASGEKAFLAGMVTDPATASHIADLSSKSDPAATAQYGEEMTSSDLRPNLANIHVPFLLISPIPKELPFGYPAEMYKMTPDQLKAAFVSFDTALFPGATTLKVVPIGNARHFAMIDQPDAFNSTLTSFIDGN